MTEVSSGPETSCEVMMEDETNPPGLLESHFDYNEAANSLADLQKAEDLRANYSSAASSSAPPKIVLTQASYEKAAQVAAEEVNDHLTLMKIGRVSLVGRQ